MGVFTKIVKKAQVRAKEEAELREKKNQEIISLQDRLDLLYTGWLNLLTELVEEANQDILSCDGIGQFYSVKSEDEESLSQTSGFGYGDNRFIFECHKEYQKEMNRNIYLKFVCYYERGTDKSSEKQIIKAKDALGPKPFTGPGNKPVSAKDFFIDTLSDAIQWWELLMPERKAG